MRNLILNEEATFQTSISNGNLIAIDSLNESIYIASKYEVSTYNVLTKERTFNLCLCDGEYLSKDNNQEQIIGLDFLQDQESLCIVTSKGDVLLWQPELDSLENVGCVEAGFTCSEWSPGQELLVLTTKNNTLIVMTRDFDPINEFSIHTEDFGEAKQMNVGWGSKETQFHGSEGKEAAKTKKNDKSSSVLTTDDGRTEISWRGDGQHFAISSINPSEGSRYVRIYNSEGVLQATNEPLEGLEQCIGWRTSGNLIASSQRKPNKHDVVFFEKNGLQHGEFTLSKKTDDKLIQQILWSPNSDILTLLVQDKINTGTSYVQLWTTSNYHWYLKQELIFKQHLPTLLWDSENPYKLHIVCQDGLYHQFTYFFDVIQSKGNTQNAAMVAVIDGSQLLLSSFERMVIPPPMSAHTISLKSPVNQVSFDVGPNKHNMLTKCSQSLAYLKYDQSALSYQSCDVLMGDSSEVLGQIVLLNGNFVASLRCNEDETQLVLFEFHHNTLRMEKRSSLKVDQKARKIFKSEDEGENCRLFLKYNNGSVVFVDYAGGALKLCLDEQFTLPHSCDILMSRKIENKTYVFGMTSHYRLFMNDKEIANDCTSFYLHEEFLLLTTHKHSLRCVYIESLVQSSEKSLDSIAFDEAVRRIERGSKIVTAVMKGTAVVLQMPRGNLECIHPRALIVTHLQTLLNSLQYKQALEIMRKHRINLNLIFDHNPKLFLKNVDVFVNDVNSANRINLFLADISSEDVSTSLYFPFYHHGDENKESNKARVSTTKVDEICHAVRSAIQNSENCQKLMLSYLTTFVRQSKPDLEMVLTKVRELKDDPSLNSIVTFEKALSYILYLVDVNQLFDIALGLYDFQVVIMVAEKSQKDPKEYLPFLNNFKNMAEHYRKFSIDKYLKRNEKALLNLAKCEDQFEELMDFVSQNELHKQALQLYQPSTEEFKKLSFAYGEYLHKKKFYEEAAIIFSRCGFHEEAISSLLHTDNWNMALMESKLNGHSQEQFTSLCRKFSDRLKSHRMFLDAATIQEQYIKDLEESVVCLLEGNLWFQALHLIQRSERDDLIETNLKPAILESSDHLTEKMNELHETFNKYRLRLQIVIENKHKEQLEIMEGLREEPQNDLFSDTSSITGQSAVSSSSRSSKGTRTSGNSRKSRAKGERKKYSLREGSKHEDFALREALAEVVNTSDSLKDEVSSLSKILLFYYFEQKATDLQSRLDDLIKLIEKHKDEIWTIENGNNTNVNFEYGPGATVQTILEQRSSTMNTQNKNDLPSATIPKIRTNVKWKLTVLSS